MSLIAQTIPITIKHENNVMPEEVEHYRSSRNQVELLEVNMDKMIVLVYGFTQREECVATNKDQIDMGLGLIDLIYQNVTFL